MSLNEYQKKLLLRDIKVLKYVKQKLQNIKSLNGYLKPWSGYTSSVSSVLCNYNSDIESVRFSVDETVYNMCRRVYNEYNNNLNLSHNCKEDDKLRIIKLRNDTESYIDDCIRDYQALLNEM